MRRKRPGPTRSLIARRLPSSSSIQACGSGAPGRVVGSYTRMSSSGRGGRGPIGHDRRRVVRVAVFDVQLTEFHRLRPHGPEHRSSGAPHLRAGRSTSGAAVAGSPRAGSRGDPELGDDREVIDGVLQRALAVPLIDASPLGFVGVEQRRRCVAREHGGELPAQVLRVVDRAGQARGRRWADAGARRHRAGARARR